MFLSLYQEYSYSICAINLQPSVFYFISPAELLHDNITCTKIKY